MLLLLCSCAEEPVTTQPSDPVFGDFTAVDLNGNSVDQTVFEDHKLTMVNIWATFCSPCINEMPALAELNTAYGDDFQIVGIVLDATDQNGNVYPDKKADAESIIQTTGADYRHLLPSPALISAQLGEIQSVPQTVFVDAEGNQVGVTYAGARSKAQWQAIIESLLEEVG
ncbi:MAG: TlpA family protein disulfide reductase [Clostridia bacterium]|nr:TlpA family protein disulfide reductase [Clostridia bacterium]